MPPKKRSATSNSSPSKSPKATKSAVAASCETPSPQGPVAAVFMDYLLQVRAEVAKQPNSCWAAAKTDVLGAMEIPYMDRILAAAARIDSNPQPALTAQMISGLLSKASCIDMQFPTELSMPSNGYYQPKMGSEWYWTGVTFKVRHPDGTRGEAAILTDMCKYRTVGQTVQAKHHWTDHQCLIMSNIATVAIRFDPPSAEAAASGAKQKEPVFVRRRPNAHWGAFDKPGDGSEKSFTFTSDGVMQATCGPDSITGSPQPEGSLNVLPLTSVVNDGDNFSCEFTVRAQDSVSKTCAWFRQGDPAKMAPGEPGTGFGGNPLPTFYYSYPQLVATAKSLIVSGVTYSIDHAADGDGEGWIDRQLLMLSLANADSPGTSVPMRQPLPFLEDPRPNSGWTWQFVNFSDRKTAWCSSAFVTGVALLATLAVQPNGYYIWLDDETKEYRCAFTQGQQYQPPTFPVTAPAGRKPFTTEPYVSTVLVPMDRKYLASGGQPKPLICFGSEGWKNVPGDFDTGATMCSEIPADFFEMNPADFLNPTKQPSSGTKAGWGYLETVSYEPVVAQTERVLHYLE